MGRLGVVEKARHWAGAWGPDLIGRAGRRGKRGLPAGAAFSVFGRSAPARPALTPQLCPRGRLCDSL